MAELRRTIDRAAVAAAILGLVTAGSVARAGAPEPDPNGGSERVAVLPVTLGGELDESARPGLEDALEQGLERKQVELLVPDAATACSDAACLAEVASSSGATHVIAAAVESEGRDFTVSVTIYAADGSEVVSASDGCEICGLREVEALLADQAAALAGQIATFERPATLRIQTTPAGASVLVDGELAGVTPFEDEISLGEHVLSIELDGHVGRRREIVAVEGVQTDLSMDLQPVPVDRRANRRVIGGVVMGLGVGLAASGAVLLGFHHTPKRDQCSGDDVDVNGTCRFRYNTLPSGIPLLVTGVVGVTAGAIVFARARKKRPANERAAVSWAPTVDGLLVRF